MSLLGESLIRLETIDLNWEVIRGTEIQQRGPVGPYHPVDLADLSTQDRRSSVVLTSYEFLCNCPY